ncbi:MAG TPA: hypothetical protein VF844_19805 [Ktedonobacteraceae bacterium]
MATTRVAPTMPRSGLPGSSIGGGVVALSRTPGGGAIAVPVAR